MLTIFGERQSFCDGISRRNFLKIGGLAMGGMSLPQLLRAESLAGARATGKSIINIYLPGGPTHMDTFDLKPNAPKEYRGEFSPIASNVPGFEFCELMPELAKIADKFSIIRSITDMSNEHSPTQSDSGWPTSSLRPMGGRPGIGAVLSKVWGPAQTTSHGTAPTTIDLTNWTKPGFLGTMHDAYRPDGQGRSNLTLNSAISLERLEDRQTLLRGLDRLQRNADSHGTMQALDSFADRAVGIITSGELARALDIKQEDPKVVARYGIDGRRETERFLVARRLVEAGARCVALSWGGWDTHEGNFKSMRDQLPRLDRALTALIGDLEERGELENTIIMMSGEFGRTPRISMAGGGGRDHWPRAAFFFLAGGGMRHGQVVGETNRLGEEPKDRPVRLQHVFHTVYHKLGIDTNAITLTDPNGRPQYVVDHRQLISELV